MFGFLKQHLPATWPALLLVILGLAAAVTATGYDVGSFTQMGPGFIPLVLGLVLATGGIIILLREPLPRTLAVPTAWRPFLAVAAGILAWVLLAESAGFFIATVAQVVLSGLALEQVRWRGLLVLAALLAIGGYLLFVVQLGVPLEAVG